MAFPKSVKQLCTPAYIYFLLSVIGIIIAIIQNVGNSGVYCLGSMSVPVSSTVMVFVVKVIGILFWTWILNLMCKDGHKEIAWFLVLLPFVLLFFMMGTAEGFQGAKPPGMQPQAQLYANQAKKDADSAAQAASQALLALQGSAQQPTPTPVATAAANAASQAATQAEQAATRAQTEASAANVEQAKREAQQAANYKADAVAKAAVVVAAMT